MLRLLDRTLIVSYVKAYVICLVSLLGLFIVVDLFTNLDDFAAGKRPLAQTLEHIGTYYSYTAFKIFDRLCEAIALMAAMFTVAWMQRNNEILPLLSAGVSTRRAVQPVLLAAVAMLGLAVVNQELVLPNVDGFLVEKRDNIGGEKEIEVRGAYESNNVHVSGEFAIRKDRTIRRFHCLIPPKLGHDSVTSLQAREAVYVPPGAVDGPAGSRTGGWLMVDTTPPQLDGWKHRDILEPLGPGRYFLYVRNADFDTVTRPRNWYLYLPTYELYEQLGRAGHAQLAGLAVVFHQRLTRPVLGMTLVLLGLAVILRDQNRNIFISAGMTLVLCATFFGACLACQFLGSSEYLSPALAAWLPVLTFGPLSFALFDAVHT